MPLSEQYPHLSSCSGRPEEFGHISEIQDRIEDFLRKSLPSIVEGLKGWTDNKRSRLNEKAIAANLCKDLNFVSADELFYFFPEDPEKKAANRTLDMGQYPRNSVRVAGHTLGGRDRLFGIEAKRLPTPNHSGEIREREYVVGRWEGKDGPNKPKTGGIERFKEGEHGADLDRAGMFGFVQKEDFNHWHTEVTGWIDELISSPLQSHGAGWNTQDRLVRRANHGPRVAEYHSTHSRSDGSTIGLSHFWLDLTEN